MNVTLLAIPEKASSAPGRAHPGASARRWTRMRAAVRQWLDRSHLGPVDNYVTR
jgi:hypothetical protein